jgi:hypothetical protein
MRRLVSLRAPSSFRFAPPVVAARSNLKSKPSPVPRRSSSRVASSSSRRAHRALDRVLRSREVPHVPRHRARRPTPRRRLPRAARRSIARAAVAAAIATVRVFVRSVDPRVVLSRIRRSRVVLTRRADRVVSSRIVARRAPSLFFFSTKARLGFRV